MKSRLEKLLQHYEPHNYNLMKNPLPIESGLPVKDYRGCSGQYSDVKFGIDENYWYLVVKNDEIDDNE